MRPLTLTRPKPMLPVGNLPFLEHMIAHLRRHGIDDIVLAMGYLPDAIEGYFGDGGRFGVSLTYELETKPLGTAGAARNALKHLDSTCFVFNGDVLTTIDLTELVKAHRERDAEATIALTPVDDPSRFGVVVRDETNRVLEFIEKPPKDQAPTNLINAGIYVLEPEVLERAPAGEYHMFENGLFPALLQASRPFYAEAPSGYWLDMGQPEHYLAANLDQANGRTGSPVSAPSTPPRSAAGVHTEGSVIWGTAGSAGENARLIGPMVIGHDVWIGEGATLERCVLMDGCRIGPGATVRDSIVGAEAVIGPGGTIDGVSVVGDGAKLGRAARLEAGSRVWPRLTVPDGCRLKGATVESQEEHS